MLIFTKSVKVRLLLLPLSLACALVLVVGVAYAAAWGGSSQTTLGGTVRFWANDDPEVYLDVDRSGESGSYIFDEVFLYLSVPKGGFASGHPSEDRAEMLVERTGSGSADEADAWMKSSADAEVKVQSDGDVVITLGS